MVSFPAEAFPKITWIIDTLKTNVLDKNRLQIHHACLRLWSNCSALLIQLYSFFPRLLCSRTTSVSPTARASPYKDFNPVATLAPTLLNKCFFGFRMYNKILRRSEKSETRSKQNDSFWPGFTCLRAVHDQYLHSMGHLLTFTAVSLSCKSCHWRKVRLKDHLHYFQSLVLLALT